MKRQAYDIPNISQSLKMDFEKGILTIEEVAEQLHEANLIPYVCIEKAKEDLNRTKLNLKINSYGYQSFRS